MYSPIDVSLAELIELSKTSNRLRIKSKRIQATSSGQRLSQFKGRGMEFDEVRPYQTGDDIRSIDWKVSARTGKPHTKVFKEERERPMLIVVDGRRSMRFATKGVFKSVKAAQIAASLAWAGHFAGDKIGGQIFDESSITEQKPQNNKGAVLRFLHSLSNHQISNKTNTATSLTDAIKRTARHAKNGTQIFIISDFRGLDERAEQRLQKLTRHNELGLIWVYDPLEANFPKRGRFNITDSISGDSVSVDAAKHYQIHQQNHQTKKNQLEKIATQHQIHLATCRTEQDPIQAILPWI